MNPEPLPDAVFARDCLGRLLVSTIGGVRTIVRVVEVEAYTGPRDPASHAADWHRSPRNEIMYGPPGFAYVYFTYGMHWCVNLVAARTGYPSAVLIRAGEPLEGIEVMRERRGGVSDRLLASGPARLTQAMGITHAMNGQNLRAAPLWLAAGERVSAAWCRRGPRIGISKAKERRLRFFVKDCVHVSR
jgi:DNA-3-methyladenine glycosylase